MNSMLPSNIFYMEICLFLCSTRTIPTSSLNSISGISLSETSIAGTTHKVQHNMPPIDPIYVYFPLMQETHIPDPIIKHFRHIVYTSDFLTCIFLIIYIFGATIVRIPCQKLNYISIILFVLILNYMGEL